MLNIQQKIQPGLTIVLCCYNSRLRLEPTLKHIAEQAGLREVKVELLLVDNNSCDGTAKFAVNLWSFLKEPFPLKILSEPCAGLIYARRRAVMEAAYSFILFCDDDNWLASDYAINGYLILSSDPKIGMLGGRGEPVFETNPPWWFHQYQKSFAIGPQNNFNGALGSNRTLYGAGLFVRTCIFKDIFSSGINSLLIGRKGSALSSGEDTELCIWCQLVGFDLHYHSSLNFRHFISTERLKEEYIKRLMAEKGKVDMIFRAYRENSRNSNSRIKYYLIFHYWEILTLALRLFINYLRKKKFARELRIVRLKSSLHGRIFKGRIISQQYAQVRLIASMLRKLRVVV